MDNNKSISLIGKIYFFSLMIMYTLVNSTIEVYGASSTIYIVFLTLLFILYLFEKKYTLKFLLSVVFFSTIGIILYLLSSQSVFLIMMFSIIIASSFEYEKVFKWMFQSRVFTIAVVTLLSLGGILPLNETEIIKGGYDDTVIGLGLGYDHPNQLASTVGITILLYLTYKNHKLKKKHLVNSLIVTLITYYITKSRTLIISIFFVLIMLYLLKSKKHVIKRLINHAAKWAFPLCILLTFGMAYLLVNSSGSIQQIVFFINGLFSSRFTYAQRVLQNYRIPLIGDVYTFESLNKLYGNIVVDNGYIQLLYSIGLIGFVVYFIFYFLSIKRLSKNKEYVYLIMIVSIATWGLSENILRSLATNFTLIFWKELIPQYSRKSQKNIITTIRRKKGIRSENTISGNKF